MDHENVPGNADAGRSVLVVDTTCRWPSELMDEVVRQGFVLVRLHDSKEIPFVVHAGDVQAVLIDAKSVGVSEIVLLRRCRESAPRMSIVVVSTATASAADVKRAMESGATAFLPFPASSDRIRDALSSAHAAGESKSTPGSLP